MDKVLHAPALARFNAGMNALVQLLEARAGIRRRSDDTTGEVAFAAANSLWGQRDLGWEQVFLDALARNYGAGMRLVNYRTDPAGAELLINAWTSGTTLGKIPRLIPPGTLDNLTRLVLVNAIHFRAPWEEPFEKPATRRRPFVTEDGAHVEVDMMSHDLRRAAVASGPGWRAARLNYIGGDIAMAVVVPDPEVPLAAVEESFDGPMLSQLLDGFRPVKAIRVEMPRWTFRVQSHLNEHLKALGMPTAFDQYNADLSGMTTQEQMYISHVLHEAFIAVDEDGTEAAAATAVVVRTLSAQRPPSLVLTADRPFMFVLFDVETATPLFIGRVSQPTNEDG